MGEMPGTPDPQKLTATERWLGNPARLGVLAIIAAVFATAATTMGEIELREAAGFGADEWRIVFLQGALWLGWALILPLLIGLAAWIAKSVRPWPVALFAHLPIALFVGSVFLGAEIKLQEWDQGPEVTEFNAGRLERREQRRIEEANFIAQGGTEREFQELLRRGPTGGGRRDAGSTGDGGGGRTGDRAGDRGTAQSGEGDRARARRRPGGGPWGGESSRWGRAGQRFRGLSINVATGDLARDFERRWLLRVPRYALIYLALIAIGLGIRSFLHGSVREREANALELKATGLEAALTEARLDALKGQLHPHFLFNALHSVGGLIRSDKNSKALTALSSIGDLLRTSLDAGGEQFVSLERELELVKRYLDVEALRLGDRLSIDITSDPGLLPCEVPAFITQPLVENAVKHGIATRPEAGHVRIHAHAGADGATLIIDIEDDGAGYTPNGRKGVGVTHVVERLATLFDDAARLEIGGRADANGSGEHGTRARLILPLENFETE